MKELSGTHKAVVEESGARPLFYTDRLCTVCLLVRDRDVLARGVAIRSPLDSVNEKRGRRKAFSRARTALFEKANSMPVVPRKIHRIVWSDAEDDNVLESHGKHLEKVIWDFKAYYQPVVLPTEAQRVDRRFKNIERMKERKNGDKPR